MSWQGPEARTVSGGQGMLAQLELGSMRSSCKNVSLTCKGYSHHSRCACPVPSSMTRRQISPSLLLQGRSLAFFIQLQTRVTHSTLRHKTTHLPCNKQRDSIESRMSHKPADSMLVQHQQATLNPLQPCLYCHQPWAMPSLLAAGSQASSHPPASQHKSPCNLPRHTARSSH